MIHCTSRFVDLAIHETSDKVGGATSITYVTLLDQLYSACPRTRTRLTV